MVSSGAIFKTCMSSWEVFFIKNTPKYTFRFILTFFQLNMNSFSCNNTAIKTN